MQMLRLASVIQTTNDIVKVYGVEIKKETRGNA